MIQFYQLQAGYHGKAITPVINGELNDGSMTALTGGNGCGKSTLLKTLAGIITPVSGTCTIQQRHAIGWLPQRNELETRFPVTVYELVAMGCWRRCGWFGAVNRALRKEIDGALDIVQMRAYADAQPATLSGGQLQRVLFARLLMQQSRVWLLDEPFSAIDAPTVTLLMELLKEQQRQGTTLLVVLHDRQLVERYFSHELALDALPSGSSSFIQQVMT